MNQTLQQKQTGSTLVTTMALLVIITLVAVQSTRDSTLGIHIAGAQQQQSRAFQCGKSELQANYYFLRKELDQNNTSKFASLIQSGLNVGAALLSHVFPDTPNRAATEPYSSIAMEYSGERSLPPPGYSIGKFKTHTFKLSAECQFNNGGGHTDQDSGLAIVGPA
jgi:Tfp pilus assembly protein PilX